MICSKVFLPNASMLDLTGIEAKRLRKNASVDRESSSCSHSEGDEVDMANRQASNAQTSLALANLSTHWQFDARQR